nr:MAG TPA: hypothetical protein [Caudoviricetes sp.]
MRFSFFKVVQVSLNPIIRFRIHSFSLFGIYESIIKYRQTQCSCFLIIIMTFFMTY